MTIGAVSGQTASLSQLLSYLQSKQQLSATQSASTQSDGDADASGSLASLSSASSDSGAQAQWTSGANSIGNDLISLLLQIQESVGGTTGSLSAALDSSGTDGGCGGQNASADSTSASQAQGTLAAYFTQSPASATSSAAASASTAAPDAGSATSATATNASSASNGLLQLIAALQSGGLFGGTTTQADGTQILVNQLNAGGTATNATTII